MNLSFAFQPLSSAKVNTESGSRPVGPSQPLALVLNCLEYSLTFAYRVKSKLLNGPILGGAYRGLLKYLWENKTIDFQSLRENYFPIELKKLVEKNYLRKDEIIFFSKDECKAIQTVLDLILLRPILENLGSQILGIPVILTYRALSYFYDYTFYKSLSFANQKKEAMAFFDPVFRQYPRLGSKISKSRSPRELTLDFNGGWRFQGVSD